MRSAAREACFIVAISSCALASLLFVAARKASSIGPSGALKWESKTSVISDLGTLSTRQNTMASAQKELASLLLAYPECQNFEVRYRAKQVIPVFGSANLYRDAKPTMSYSRVIQKWKFSIDGPNTVPWEAKLTPEQAIENGRKADPIQGRTNWWSTMPEREAASRACRKTLLSLR